MDFTYREKGSLIDTKSLNCSSRSRWYFSWRIVLLPLLVMREGASEWNNLRRPASSSPCTLTPTRNIELYTCSFTQSLVTFHLLHSTRPFCEWGARFTLPFTLFPLSLFSSFSFTFEREPGLVARVTGEAKNGPTSATGQVKECDLWFRVSRVQSLPDQRPQCKVWGGECKVQSYILYLATCLLRQWKKCLRVHFSTVLSLMTSSP